MRSMLYVRVAVLLGITAAVLSSPASIQGITPT